MPFSSHFLHSTITFKCALSLPVLAFQQNRDMEPVLEEALLGRRVDNESEMVMGLPAKGSPTARMEKVAFNSVTYAVSRGSSHNGSIDVVELIGSAARGICIVLCYEYCEL